MTLVMRFVFLSPITVVLVCISVVVRLKVAVVLGQSLKGRLVISSGWAVLWVM